MSDFKYYLIINRHLPFEVLRLLTADRWFWARNHTTPPDILTELSKDREAIVRYQVAKHPNVPTHVLDELSQDRVDLAGVIRNCF